MNHTEIMDRLRAIMRQASQANVNWDTVGAASSIEEMGFDSLAILDLIYDIQQGFGLEFDAEEIARVRTVGELADFLAARLA
jgi:acyl carrier protein